MQLNRLRSPEGPKVARREQAVNSVGATSRTFAFVDVNVVPMDSERILPEQTVLVRDGRIAEIGPVAQTPVPADALRVDGRDRFLMPGLMDVHVHTWDERELLLFLANGVTAVRNMWGAPRHLRWREQIARGELLGPAIYTTGPLIDGAPPIWNGSTVVETAEEAARVVAAHKQAGYDAIKVYNRLSREAYDGLIMAAKRHGMPVVGHVPHAVGLEHVLAARQASVEHLQGYIQLIQADDSPVRGEVLISSLREALMHVDEAKIPWAAALTRDAGVWNCVTLVVFQKFVPIEEAQALRNRPEMAYVLPQTLASWDPSKDFRLKRMTADDFAALRRTNMLRKKLTAALHEAGARLLLGTDTPNPFVVPGFAIHEELQNLVDAGLTPYEAIRAGTRGAAEFLNELGEFGTVTVGARADLILVEHNPLEDVGNVARRVGVMVRGRWLPEDELRRMLDDLAASFTVPKEYFATVPALPREGERVFFGRYELTFSEVSLGEERVAVERLADRRMAILAQAVLDTDVDQGTYMLRLEIDAGGDGQRLRLESDGPDGRGHVEMVYTDGRVQVTGSVPSQQSIDLEVSSPSDGLLGAPLLATTVLLGKRLTSLAVGQTASFILHEMGLAPDFSYGETTLQVERKPDATKELPWGMTAVRVYAIEAAKQTAAYKSTLTIDHQGWPATLEVEEQLGVRHYRRLE